MIIVKKKMIVVKKENNHMQIKFIDSSRFMQSKLSDLVHNRDF